MNGSNFALLIKIIKNDLYCFVFGTVRGTCNFVWRSFLACELVVAVQQALVLADKNPAPDTESGIGQRYTHVFV